MRHYRDRKPFDPAGKRQQERDQRAARRKADHLEHNRRQVERFGLDTNLWDHWQVDDA